VFFGNFSIANSLFFCRVGLCRCKLSLQVPRIARWFPASAWPSCMYYNANLFNTISYSYSGPSDSLLSNMRKMFAIAKSFVLTVVTSCNISVRKSHGFYRLLIIGKRVFLLQVVHNTTVNARLRLQQLPVTIADRNDNFTHYRCQPSCSLECS